MKSSVARVSSFKRPFLDNQKSGTSAHLEGHKRSFEVRRSCKNAVQVEAATLLSPAPGGEGERDCACQSDCRALPARPAVPEKAKRHRLLAEEALMEKGRTLFLGQQFKPGALHRHSTLITWPCLGLTASRLCLHYRCHCTMPQGCHSALTWPGKSASGKGSSALWRRAH